MKRYLLRHLILSSHPIIEKFVLFPILFDADPSMGSRRSFRIPRWIGVNIPVGKMVV